MQKVECANVTPYEKHESQVSIYICIYMYMYIFDHENKLTIDNMVSIIA